jgi:hypothetical protein
MHWLDKGSVLALSDSERLKPDFLQSFQIQQVSTVKDKSRFDHGSVYSRVVEIAKGIPFRKYGQGMSPFTGFFGT